MTKKRSTSDDIPQDILQTIIELEERFIQPFVSLYVGDIDDTAKTDLAEDMVCEFLRKDAEAEANGLPRFALRDDEYIALSVTGDRYTEKETLASEELVGLVFTNQRLFVLSSAVISQDAAKMMRGEAGDRLNSVMQFPLSLIKELYVNAPTAEFPDGTISISMKTNLDAICPQNRLMDRSTRRRLKNAIAKYPEVSYEVVLPSKVEFESVRKAFCNLREIIFK